MDIKEALEAAATGLVAMPEVHNHKVSELPKTDVVVQRALLLSALARITRLEEQLGPRAAVPVPAQELRITLAFDSEVWEQLAQLREG